MWDTYRLPANGNFSLRKIAVLLFAVITTALLWTVIFSPTSHAADATWDGDAIVKDGNKYVKDSGSISDVPAGFQAYVFKPQNGTTAQVIYFPGNVDPSKQAFTAQQMTYELVNGQYGGHGPPTTVSVDVKSTEQNKEKTQCDVQGIGWIICATSRFLAGAMDNFFAWISGFLEVKPITNDTKSGLYQAWSIMLGLANSAFVLAFLVIIYSQITSVGFNNYNIKKMIPKLIVAAILVNVSYYICAIAVDISNILGHSLQQALVDIRNSLPSPNPGGVDLSWKNLTEYLLSGGTIAAAGFAGWAAFSTGAGASVTALVPLLFPMLIFGMLAFITALLVLAARQALITILIVISPLAFVAYLLPNTEKWFEKWRELFTTMLMVFPLFSLLFGGSQLASFIIIQNADKPSVAIFGLFIQAAPFAITPFLVKFSGGLVGRLAGMISGGTKGMQESASGWAKERVDKRRGIAMEQAARGRGTFMQRSAFRREKSRLDREAYKKRGEEAIDAGWHEDRRYRGHHSQFGYTEDRKKTAEAFATEHMEHEAKGSRTWQEFRGQRRLSEDVTKNLQAREQASWEEAKTGQSGADNPYAGLASEAKAAYRMQRIAQDNTTIAQGLQKSEYANDVSIDAALQAQAGGIGGELGAIKVKAAAMSEVIESGAAAVKAIQTASAIKPGDVPAMRAAFDRAVAENDVASMRAHADMMASSANVGVNELRKAIIHNEAAIRANPNLDTFRHHINSSATINAAAEDVAVWSRDANNNFRTLAEVGQASATWKNLTANAIAGMKASSQDLALDAKIQNSDGSWSWAVSPQMARDIRRSQAWAGVKEEMKPKFEARMTQADMNWPLNP